MAIALTHSGSQRARTNQIDIYGLRRRWCAGRRIVGEKLLVNCYNKKSYEADRHKRTKQGGTQRFRRGSDMGCLADMAGSFILSLSVRMV
jgi:hypothetical protein